MVKAYRPFLLAVHKYVGLILGVLITLIAVSGSIVVYKPEIEGALAPDLYYVEPGPKVASLKEVVESTLAAYPERRPVYLALNDGHPGRTYQFDVHKEGERDISVFVNPYTAEVIGARSGSTLISVIRNLHVNLLMGSYGIILVGLVSIAMLVTFFVGLILWWPSKSSLKRSLTLSWRFGFERFLRDLHNVSGIYLLLVTFVLTFTGTAIVFPNVTKAAFKLVVPGGYQVFQKSPQSQPLPDGRRISVAQAVQVVRNAVPEKKVEQVWGPYGPRGNYIVGTAPKGALIQAPHQVLLVDQYSGDILRGPTTADPNVVDQFFNGWVDPLHTGAAFGELGRFIAFIGGLALPVLFGSGTYMWYRRRQRS